MLSGDLVSDAEYTLSVINSHKLVGFHLLLLILPSKCPHQINSLVDLCVSRNFVSVGANYEIHFARSIHFACFAMSIRSLLFDCSENSEASILVIHLMNGLFICYYHRAPVILRGGISAGFKVCI